MHRRFYKTIAKQVPLLLFKNILTTDCKKMAELVLPSTLKDIVGLRQTYLEKCLRVYIERRLKHSLASPHTTVRTRVSNS